MTIVFETRNQLTTFCSGTATVSLTYFRGCSKTRNEMKRRNDLKQEATPEILILTAHGCSEGCIQSRVLKGYKA